MAIMFVSGTSVSISIGFKLREGRGFVDLFLSCFKSVAVLRLVILEFEDKVVDNPGHSNDDHYDVQDIQGFTQVEEILIFNGGTVSIHEEESDLHSYKHNILQHFQGRSYTAPGPYLQARNINKFDNIDTNQDYYPNELVVGEDSYEKGED